ncbi:hypothetical protein RTBOTA2_005619 [Rhodotorula toruloides]|uniref:FGENESH: predicted gene_11.8 protein n=1 Tax=Rhodotorula toruloides TaxID=5286 RepID=A0A0K3CR19_RHOTO|nr:hypothetical protein RTBOTA2_005619 [Rhodotorula toruloides]
MSKATTKPDHDSCSDQEERTSWSEQENAPERDLELPALSPGMLKLLSSPLYITPLPFDLKPLPTVPPLNPADKPARL